MADRGQLGNTFSTGISPRYGYVHKGIGPVTRRANSKPLLAPHQREESIQDQRDPAKMARMYEESAGVENFANRKDVVERAKMAGMELSRNTIKDSPDISGLPETYRNVASSERRE